MIARFGDTIATLVMTFACLIAMFRAPGLAAAVIWWAASIGLLILSERALDKAIAELGGEQS